MGGKIALVTGGARGMGEAEARLFVAEGAKVVVADVLDEAGQAVVADIGENAMYVHLDVSREDDWAAAVAATVERFGAPTVLVNNAGIARYHNLDQMPKEELIAHFSVNVLGRGWALRPSSSRCAGEEVGPTAKLGSTKASGGGPGVRLTATPSMGCSGSRRAGRSGLGRFGFGGNW